MVPKSLKAKVVKPVVSPIIKSLLDHSQIFSLTLEMFNSQHK